ncbi:hypothetical protein VPH35_022277 [Triticum aestivum]
MAGIMVSASTGVMNSLLGKLATLMGEEFAKLKNLRKEVKYISDELSGMKDALERLADVDELDVQIEGGGMRSGRCLMTLRILSMTSCAKLGRRRKIWVCPRHYSTSENFKGPPSDCWPDRGHQENRA